MTKEAVLEVEGEVIEVLPSTIFRVQISGGHLVLCSLSGKMRQRRIRVILGDRVKIEITPYDLTRGRIVWRYA